MHRNPLAGEVYDPMLGDPVAFVGDGDEVVDFVDGSGVGTGSTGGKDIRHRRFRFQKPPHSSIEVLLCKEEYVRTIRGRYHR